MSSVEITSLSSKGQIVIPNQIRDELGVKAGTKFVVISDGTNVLLKPITKPKMDTFKKLISRSQSYARKHGLKKADIKKTIKRVRNERSS